MIRNLCQSKWKLKEQRLHKFWKKIISMEECTEMLSSEESHVFFYQDIFKLSFKVGSLPLMSLSRAVQKHLTTPTMPQHRQTGQEKVPDSLVHRLIKVHSCQPDDRVSSSGIAWSFFALHLRICICIHTMKIKFWLKKGFRPLLEAVKMSIMFLIRTAGIPHTKSLWEINSSVSRLIFDSVVFTTTVDW